MQHTENRRKTLEIRGKDRSSWLNGLVTCDVAALVPGAAMFGVFVNRTGKIQSDVWLLADGDSIYVSVPEHCLDAVKASLDAHLIMEDAEIVESTLESRICSLAARSQHARLSGAFRWGTWELQLEFGTGLENADLRFEELRFRHGMPLFGAEVDSAMHPHEGSLETVAVSFSKGCYLGQEVVCMVELRGQTSRRLARIRLDAPVPIGATIRAVDGSEVGAVRGVWQSDNEVLGFALLKRAAVTSGAALTVEVKGLNVTIGACVLGAGPA